MGQKRPQSTNPAIVDDIDNRKIVKLNNNTICVSKSIAQNQPEPKQEEQEDDYEEDDDIKIEIEKKSSTSNHPSESLMKTSTSPKHKIQKLEEEKQDTILKKQTLNDDVETAKVDANSRYHLLTFDTEVHDWIEGVQIDPISRITQLGWTIFDQTGQIIKTKTAYIKPDGWRVSKKAEKYTKITQELLMQKGEPIREVISEFQSDYHEIEQNKGFISAHEYEYDATMILQEIERDSKLNESAEFSQLKSKLKLQASQSNHIIDIYDLKLLRRLNKFTKFTTTAEGMGLEKKFWKWYPSREYGPRLADLHRIVVGGDKYKNAHDAQVDAEMCGEVIHGLQNKYEVNLFEL